MKFTGSFVLFFSLIHVALAAQQPATKKPGSRPDAHASPYFRLNMLRKTKAMGMAAVHPVEVVLAAALVIKQQMV